MTRLLVSVRSALEAEAAIAGGADLIDVKEPLRGALGAADSNVLREVVESVAGRRPVSAALGELRELNLAQLEIVPGLSFVKAGLACCRDRFDWIAGMRTLRDALPKPTALVAVAYADWRSAGAPPPKAVLDVATELAVPIMLIDTFDKHAGGLWSHFEDNELASLLRRARNRDVQVALAGSLGLADVARAQDLKPQWIAVRGAACRGSRTSAVCVERVAALREALDAKGA